MTGNDSQTDAVLAAQVSVILCEVPDQTEVEIRQQSLEETKKPIFVPQAVPVFAKLLQHPKMNIVKVNH